LNIFIVSHNPLFSEVLAEMLCPVLALEITCIDPDLAKDTILSKSPAVIIVDQAISTDLQAQILDAARSLKKSKVVLLTARENDYVLIQSENLTLTGVDDLIRNLKDEALNNTNLTSVIKKRQTDEQILIKKG
jgi:hypothetical protein